VINEDIYVQLHHIEVRTSCLNTWTYTNTTPIVHVLFWNKNVWSLT